MLVGVGERCGGARSHWGVNVATVCGLGRQAPASVRGAGGAGGAGGCRGSRHLTRASLVGGAEGVDGRGDGSKNGRIGGTGQTLAGPGSGGA